MPPITQIPPASQLPTGKNLPLKLALPVERHACPLHRPLHVLGPNALQVASPLVPETAPPAGCCLPPSPRDAGATFPGDACPPPQQTLLSTHPLVPPPRRHTPSDRPLWRPSGQLRQHAAAHGLVQPITDAGAAYPWERLASMLPIPPPPCPPSATPGQPAPLKTALPARSARHRPPPSLACRSARAPAAPHGAASRHAGHQ